MKKLNKLSSCLAAALILTFGADSFASDVEVGRNSVTLDFSSHAGQSKCKYTVKRSTGRLSEFKTIGKTSDTRFTDKKIKGSPYSYYYLVLDAAGDTVAALSPESELFGPNVHIYSPTDSPEGIAAEMQEIHNQMFRAEMGKERHTVLFKPGDYTSAGLFKVGFYTHVAGLGKVPYDVKIHNVHTPPHLKNDNGTCTFWRSLENFSVIGEPSYEHEDMFNWAVSQAAPFRRMYSQRTVRNQWKYGWVSGGFTADCVFDAPVGSDGQQQWYTRNSFLQAGRGKFSEGAYNFVFNGVELGSDADKPTYADSDWDKGGNVTFIETTPVVREKPFLFLGDDGRYKVFRPALRRESKGVSYTRTDMGDGVVLDLLDSFMIVKPGDTTSEMNAALASGKNLLFTPGIFELTEPLHVSRPDAIVMGLGWATIVPADKSEAAVIVDDVDGVQIASILFDAHHSSRTLLRVGDKDSAADHSANPVVLSDVFFRIGGFIPQKVHVDCAVELNSNNVVGDHFWIWRADHGVRNSVGWDVNSADNGLIVNGDDVTIYGLFNEHFQKYQTLWQGERGKVFFYQCETPYDARNQEEFMSENGTRCGYAAYKVADNVHSHNAYGIGIYDVLHNDIMLENSVEAPDHKGIELHHIVNTSFIPGPRKGFKNVLNGMVESTYPHAQQYVARINHFSGKN
ncbi:MAG: glycoside hydrolase family 16 [Muribaculaceae bacterium]|nr:glycoside hydrolase family 16 [Muribaculaceae bacterium]